MKSKSNVRIVDIAKMAGVSIGTVDRVLHNRGHVSNDKRERVEKVLKEINYEPNLVARFLASKKSYTFAAIIPSFEKGSYWELASEGIDRAEDEQRKFNIKVEYFYFDQYNRESFVKAMDDLLSKDFDGVVIATLFSDFAINLSKKLDEKGIPYIYIDSDIPEQNDLAYFGGDSFISGYIAAKLLTQEIGLNANIFFAHIKFKHREVSLQMRTRELGFMNYLSGINYTGEIKHIELDPDNVEDSMQTLTDLLSSNVGLIGGIVLNSRVYELIEFLQKIDESLTKNLRLVGHDALDRNITALKKGQVSYILSQRPDLQGYDAVKALGNYFLFKQMPTKKNYMPIDILLKENVDYYKNYKL